MPPCSRLEPSLPLDPEHLSCYEPSHIRCPFFIILCCFFFSDDHVWANCAWGMEKPKDRRFRGAVQGVGRTRFRHRGRWTTRRGRLQTGVQRTATTEAELGVQRCTIANPSPSGGCKCVTYYKINRGMLKTLRVYLNKN